MGKTLRQVNRRDRKKEKERRKVRQKRKIDYGHDTTFRKSSRDSEELEDE